MHRRPFYGLLSYYRPLYALFALRGQKQAALRTNDFDIDCGQFMV